MTLDDIMRMLATVEDEAEFERLWNGLGEAVAEASRRVVAERRSAAPAEPPEDAVVAYKRGYQAGYYRGTQRRTTPEDEAARRARDTRMFLRGAASHQEALDARAAARAASGTGAGESQS